MAHCLERQEASVGEPLTIQISSEAMDNRLIDWQKRKKRP